jgi:hypothetical protein
VILTPPLDSEDLRIRQKQPSWLGYPSDSLHVQRCHVGLSRCVVPALRLAEHGGIKRSILALLGSDLLEAEWECLS